MLFILQVFITFKLKLILKGNIFRTKYSISIGLCSYVLLLMCVLTDNVYALVMSRASWKGFLIVPRMDLLGFVGVSAIPTWISEKWYI
jgi:hypothetical protein